MQGSRIDFGLFPSLFLLQGRPRESLGLSPEGELDCRCYPFFASIVDHKKRVKASKFPMRISSIMITALSLERLQKLLLQSEKEINCMFQWECSGWALIG